MGTADDGTEPVDLDGTAGQTPTEHPERMSSREAAVTLIGALERAGEPWSFLASEALAGVELKGSEIRAWPITLSDGEMLGMAVRRPGSSSHDELVNVLLRTLSGLLAAERAAVDALKRARAAEEEARVDSLTGLVNRRAWENALVAETARMRRSGSAAVVVVVDIDGLKETNDAEGHLEGDLLIRCAGEALRRVVRDEDVVARLGGDEFGVLAVEAAADPEALIERLEQSLLEADVQASLGAAVGRPGEPLSAAVEQADRNMYADKRRRKRLAHQRG